MDVSSRPLDLWGPPQVNWSGYFYLRAPSFGVDNDDDDDADEAMGHKSRQERWWSLLSSIGLCFLAFGMESRPHQRPNTLVLMMMIMMMMMMISQDTHRPPLSLCVSLSLVCDVVGVVISIHFPSICYIIYHVFIIESFKFSMANLVELETCSLFDWILIQRCLNSSS